MVVEMATVNSLDYVTYLEKDSYLVHSKTRRIQ